MPAPETSSFWAFCREKSIIRCFVSPLLRSPPEFEAQPMFKRSTFLGLCVALALVSICISDVGAQDLSGTWKGKWTSPGSSGRRAHQGTLNMRLRPTGPGTYQGLFYGRFAVVIPYAYRAQVSQAGNHVQSVKRLGPLGNYSMSLCASGACLNGSWQAGSHRGGISLRRR